MDTEIKEDGVYHVTYAPSEMPTFTSSQYSGDIQGYFTQELDWQNGAIDTSRSMYSIAPRPEIAPQIPYYSTYQPNTHPEIYQSSVLWTGATANGTTIGHGTPSRRESRGGTNTNGRPKRRRTQSVVQRRAANVRERRRMFQLNEAFDALRKRLPAFNYEKRLSRIETLRLAMTYIAFMQDVTSGTDPKHVKLLSYQSDDSIHKYEVQSNGYDSSTMHEQLEMVGHEEHTTELPSLIDASHRSMDQSSAIQPVTPEPTDLSLQSVQEHEHEMQSSAVHVEMMHSEPPTITLPVTNHVIITEAEVRAKEEEEGEREEEEEIEEVREEINETAQATQHLEKYCPSE